MPEQRREVAEEEVAERRSIIELDPVRVIEGRVIFPDRTPAVERARVVLRAIPRDSSSSKSDVDGSFSLSGLPLGEVLLEASAPGLISGEAVHVAVREESSSGVELRLGAGTVLHCRIADDCLTPSRLSVRIFDSRGHDRAVSLPTAGRERAADRFERTFGPLPPGTYRVELIQGTESIFEASLELRGTPEKELLLGN